MNHRVAKLPVALTRSSHGTLQETSHMANADEGQGAVCYSSSEPLFRSAKDLLLLPQTTYLAKTESYVFLNEE